MHTCPNCGHTWEDQARASGGKARWKGTTKRERSAAASAAVAARWKDPAARKAASEAARRRWAVWREARAAAG